MLNLLFLSDLETKSLPGKERGPATKDAALNSPEEEGQTTYVGEGIADGEATVPPPDPAPVPVVGAGLLTVGLLAGAVPDRVLNQFHCVKPKNSTIRTRSARIAAAIPAPAPDPVVSLVSTTSEPAGLQYRRTL